MNHSANSRLTERDMKLTQTLRDAFILAAMRDVPSIDYREQAQKLAQADLCAQMPPKVMAVYKDTELRTYLKCEYWHGTPRRLPSLSLYGKGILQLTTQCMTGLGKIADAHVAQEDARSSLESKLRAVAHSVTTRKMLAEALPEFAKYLPADEPAAVRSLPVVANVIADFKKAGWPGANQKAVA